MARMSRHELKHDEMEDIGMKASEWFNRNSSWLSGLIIVVALGFIGYRAYGWYEKKESSKAAAELTEVYAAVGAAMSAPEGDARKEAYEKAVSEATRVASARPNSPVGRAAQLALGNVHYHRAATFGIESSDEFQTELKSARDAYERYIGMATTPLEKAAGQLALGNVLENQLLVATDARSLSSDAEKAYKEAADLAPKSYLAAEALLAQARLIANQEGRTEEARKLLENIARDRKLPEVKPDDMPKSPARTSTGQEVSPEELVAIRQFAELSAAREAERLARTLNALPGVPQN